MTLLNVRGLYDSQYTHDIQLTEFQAFDRQAAIPVTDDILLFVSLTQAGRTAALGLVACCRILAQGMTLGKVVTPLLSSLLAIVFGPVFAARRQRLRSEMAWRCPAIFQN